jgi:hypothetical protein
MCADFYAFNAIPSPEPWQGAANGRFTALDLHPLSIASLEIGLSTKRNREAQSSDVSFGSAETREFRSDGAEFDRRSLFAQHFWEAGL